MPMSRSQKRRKYSRRARQSFALRSTTRHHRELEKKPGYVSSVAVKTAFIGKTDLFEESNGFHSDRPQNGTTACRKRVA